ncbi:MAG: NifU N-terminal domain-containing protein [Phycisphaerales bacterium]
MPLIVREYHETPNPNAVRLVLDRQSGGPFPEGLSTRWYTSAAAAADDPLARELLALPGVSAVLIGAGWLTINKDAQASWRAIKRNVERVLARVE